MKDMYEYIGNVNKNSVIVDYEVDGNSIKIKTSDNKDVIIDREDNYINFLNDIIKTQQQYKNVERRKYLLKKDKFNKIERIIMYIFLLVSIALVIYFTNIYTSLILLIFIISSIVSEVTHIHNVMELRKLNNNTVNTKNIVVDTDDVYDEINKDDMLKLIGINEDIKLLPLPQDEILYLDDEM